MRDLKLNTETLMLEEQGVPVLHLLDQAPSFSPGCVSVSADLPSKSLHHRLV